MKKRILLWSCLAFFAVACHENGHDIAVGGGEEETAQITLALRNNIQEHEMLLTRAADQPETGDFLVRLENTRAEVLRVWRYDTLPSVIRVVPGSYKLVAYYGDRDCLPAFDTPFYYGETKATLQQGEYLDTVVHTSVATVKVALSFDESFDFDYDDYFVEVKTVGDSLHFAKDEKREGYFLPGHLRMRFGLKPKGQDKYYEFYPEAIRDVKAAEFYRMTLKAQSENGALSRISIITDTAVIHIPVNVDLPSFMLPKAPPKVTMAGDDAAENVMTTEGVGKNVMVSVMSSGGLTELLLKTTSDTLLARGWPVEIDLMKASVEEKARLKAEGLTWSELIDSPQEAVKSPVVVNFSGVAKSLCTAPGKTAVSSFEIVAKDQYGQTGNECKFVLSVAPPVFDFVNTPGEGNVWATRTIYDVRYISEVRKPVVECQGNDGIWKTLETTLTNTAADEYRCLAKGVTPATDYAFRVRLGGHTLDAGRFQTEAAAQVPNSGFEEWYEERLHKANGTGGKDIYVFYPYSQSASTAEEWWNTRNLTTTQKLTSTWYYAMFPGTVPTGKSDWMAMNHLNRFDGKSFDLSGYAGNSMEIATIGWGKNNWSAFGHGTENKTAGLLYIGSYDLNAHTEQYGHAFSSRPLSVKFFYKFYSYNSETTKAYAEIKDKDGNRIGYGELKITDTADAYKEGKILLSYSQLNKAVSISIVFLSTDAESPATKDIQGDKGAFAGYGDSRHIGSILTVDEVELIYE